MNNISVLGLDLAKNSFQAAILNGHGKQVRQRTLRRQQVLEYLMNADVDVIAMEACSGAHHLARTLQAAGRAVQLLPSQHVKGYLRGQKNDRNDALAIAEACQHGRIRPVQVKTQDHQDDQAFHRIRNRLKQDQTGLINQMRGLLSEYGLVIAQGVASFRKEIPWVLEDAENGLSPRFRELLHRRYQHWLALQEELDWFDQCLNEQVKQNPVCQKLMELPGVGPVVSSQLACWMGNGHQFSRGRDASAALGVVPRQYSTGGRESLYGITKRGDPNLRAAMVHGCRAVVAAAVKKGKDDQLSQWIQSLVARRGFNKAVVALVNKLVRVAWVIVARGESYRPAG